MKEKYVLLNMNEIMLIMNKITELEHDLREIMKKKNMVINDDKCCAIRFDSKFLMPDDSIEELYELAETKGK